MILFVYTPSYSISLQQTYEISTKRLIRSIIKQLRNNCFFILLLTFCPIQKAKAQTMPLTGKLLFENKCAKCHGNDGTRGRWGAKNLRISKLNDDELFRTISTGKGIMPNWGRKLTSNQIVTVIEYIKTLRK